jgi:hypothetical protein
MNTIKFGLAAIAAVILFAGCGDKVARGKEAELEKRLTLMESNSANMQTNMERLDGLVMSNLLEEMTMEVDQLGWNKTNGDKTDQLREAIVLLADAESNLSSFTKELDGRLGKLEPTNRFARQTPQAPPRYVPAAQTKDGVPMDIYNAITADAVKHWPGDYEMQAYQIKTQTDAYRKLHP